MPESKHTQGRAIYTASIDNTALVKHQIDLGRSYSTVTIGIDPGIADGLQVFPAAAADLLAGSYSPTGGAPRLGQVGAGYVQWLHFEEGPYRHFCFVWDTGGISGAYLKFFASETGVDVTPVVAVATKTESKVA